MVDERNRADIKRDWKIFVETGTSELVTVRAQILESWQRCMEAGVDPFEDISGFVLDPVYLSSLINSKKVLINITRPFMQKLYQFVAGTGFIVMFSDEQGYLLEILGERETMHKGKEINLIQGSRWTEEIVGTNGVGTALVLQAPVQVSGEEHYCKQLHEWTCSAAPIYDNNRRLAGVLQLSGPHKASHKHTLGMAVAAAQAIEEQLQINEQNRELILVSNRLHNVFHTISEGVVIINKKGIIEQVNPVAERIIKKPVEALEGVRVEDIFREVPRIREMLRVGESCSDIEIHLSSDGQNIHCLASGKAIRDEEGKLNGGVIILSPIKKIKNLVNRFSGAQARFTFGDIIGKSPQIQEAIRTASMAASNDSNVLLQGESGTGKEIFAQAIHNRSSRRNGPFLALNCAAIPRDLLGSELFGYVEGAFTGAHPGGRPGKFELASGGTLFLDEIGDMNFGKQGALLRAIQERAVVRIGDNRVIPVDVRIICASNKNLQQAVEKGDFRRDLYYRLNVLSISLPPLRQHPEDIPLIFDYFVKQVSQRQGTKIDYIEPEIVSILLQYHWPGNVRELENVVERMVCMARNNMLSTGDIPSEISRGFHDDYINQDQSLSESELSVNSERDKRKKLFQEQEKKEIMDLIIRYGGNISSVARQMGFSRNTIYRKIKQYDISI